MVNANIWVSLSIEAFVGYDASDYCLRKGRCIEYGNWIPFKGINDLNTVKATTESHQTRWFSLDSPAFTLG